jgi:hypothetical protein
MFDLKFLEIDCPDPLFLPLRGTAHLSVARSFIQMSCAGGGPEWDYELGRNDCDALAFELAAAGVAELMVDKPVRRAAMQPGQACVRLRPTRSVRRTVMEALDEDHSRYVYYEVGNGDLDVVARITQAVWLPGQGYQQLLYATAHAVHLTRVPAVMLAVGDSQYYSPRSTLPMRGAGPPVLLDELRDAVAGMTAGWLTLRGGPKTGERMAATVRLLTM